MFIIDEFVNDENSPYVKTFFTYNHQDNNIDIEIHSRIVDEQIESIIANFDDILPYFVDDTEEALEELMENDFDKYVTYISHVHNGLLEFFYEEECIKGLKIISIYIKGMGNR